LIARESTRLVTPLQKIENLQELHLVYRDNPQISFRIAEHARVAGRLADFADHAYLAYALAPDIPEYRLYASLAAEAAGDIKRARHLADGLDATSLYGREKAMRQEVLNRLG